MNVSATPIPVARANSRSADAAPTRATPLPASTIGCSAPRMIAAAAQQLALARLGAADAACARAAARRRPSSPITSSGSSMCVGPGFCACATLNALRTTSGITREELQPHVPLRHGRNIETTSMCWCDSLCIRSRSAWPVSATSGERSRNASATPVTRFVAPGPSVPRQTPARCGQPPVHVGHVGAALLVANRYERDRGVLERLVEVERLLARDAEDVADALGLEALHEQVRRLALRHDSPSASIATSAGPAVSGYLRDAVARRSPARVPSRAVP